MLVLDFLFNVCFCPFRNAKKGGRLGALLLLSPILTYLIFGLINLTFYTIEVSPMSILSPTIFGVLMFLTFLLIYRWADFLYIKNNRELKKIKYPSLHLLILPIFFFGSIIFFGYTIGLFA